jgi:hypothetical protein
MLISRGLTSICTKTLSVSSLTPFPPFFAIRSQILRLRLNDRFAPGTAIQQPISFLLFAYPHKRAIGPG